MLMLVLAGCATSPPIVPPAATPRSDAGVSAVRSDAVRRIAPAPAPLPPAWRCEDPSALPGDCFVRIASGTFLQGAQATAPDGPGYDPAARPDEGPPRRVTLPPFRLGRHEVSRAGYRACVASGWCASADLLDPAWLDVHGDDARERGLAVAGLSWTGAARVCAWLGGRLPTEAEWELAARGASGRRFPWGDTPRCGVKRVVPVTSEEACASDGVRIDDDLDGATPEGVSGLAGNVWEWMADVYAPDAYAGGDAVDPRGPGTGEARVQRGGGWTSTDPLELRAAARGSLVPDGRLPDVGARCARDETP